MASSMTLSDNFGSGQLTKKERKMNFQFGRILAGLFLLGVTFIPATSFAEIIRADKNGIALEGYDLVSYFTIHTPTRGSAKYPIKINETTFYFSSAENRQLFRKNPRKYLPKYGGYCAFGVAKNNAKVPSDPRTFKIYNGQLLLFYNDFYQGQVVNTIVPWNQDEQTWHVKAEKNWLLLKED
jgi:YHS domain-containing protein